MAIDKQILINKSLFNFMKSNNYTLHDVVNGCDIWINDNGIKTTTELLNEFNCIKWQ